MGSDILFATPSSLYGIARTFDLFGRFTQFNVSRTPNEADRIAMLADELAINSDLRASLLPAILQDPELVRLVCEAIDRRPSLAPRSKIHLSGGRTEREQEEQAAPA